MKFVILLIVLALALGGGSNVLADTKILHNINIEDGGSSRNEQISLNNAGTAEEELVIEGMYHQYFYPSDAAASPKELTTIYVADKNGYRAKYTLGLGGAGGGFKPLGLNPSTFKTLTG